jgi:hypothetical protein
MDTGWGGIFSKFLAAKGNTILIFFSITTSASSISPGCSSQVCPNVKLAEIYNIEKQQVSTNLIK